MLYKSFDEQAAHAFDDFFRLIYSAQAKVQLSNIFFTIKLAIIGEQKQDLIEILEILLNTLPSHQHLMWSEEVYRIFFQHVRDVKSAVELEAKAERKIAWKRIEEYLRVYKHSFILDIDALKQLADVD